jgi:putative oxidoreductase
MTISFHFSGPRLLSGFVGLMLLWAGISKAADPAGFLGSLHAYELGLPRAVLMPVAVVLPWLELFCGLLLLTGTRVQTGLAAALVLFAVFTIATAQAALRGLDISCGCFDASLLTTWGLDKARHALESPLFASVRNLALLGCVGWLLARGGGERVADRSARQVP